MKRSFLFVITAIASIAFMACGGKSNNDDYDGFDDIEGDPEKVAFIEDFYGKFYESLNDHESLYNLVSDALSERGDSIAKRMVGGEEKDIWKALKPNSLDSLPDVNMIEPAFVSLREMPDVDDKDKNSYYDVNIEDLNRNPNTLMLYVIGTNGNFKIDSISNPDFEKKTETEEEPKEGEVKEK